MPKEHTLAVTDSDLFLWLKTNKKEHKLYLKGQFRWSHPSPPLEGVLWLGFGFGVPEPPIRHPKYESKIPIEGQRILITTGSQTLDSIKAVALNLTIQGEDRLHIHMFAVNTLLVYNICIVHYIQWLLVHNICKVKFAHCFCISSYIQCLHIALYTYKVAYSYVGRQYRSNSLSLCLRHLGKCIYKHCSKMENTLGWVTGQGPRMD